MPLHKQQEMLSFHTGSPTAQPVGHTALPPLPPHSSSCFPSSLPPHPRQAFLFSLPSTGVGEGEAGTPAGGLRPLQGPAPSSCGLSHHIQVSSPSSGKTTGESDHLPVLGRCQPRCLWRGNGENTEKSESPLNPLNPPPRTPASAPPGSAPALGPQACLGAELGRQKLVTNQATAPHTRLAPQEMNRIWKIKPRHGNVCLLD